MRNPHVVLSAGLTFYALLILGACVIAGDPKLTGRAAFRYAVDHTAGAICFSSIVGIVAHGVFLVYHAIAG
jgi:hypothetical protein